MYTENCTIQTSDRKIEKLWEQFEDVPMNPDTECMDGFLVFLQEHIGKKYGTGLMNSTQKASHIFYTTRFEIELCQCNRCVSCRLLSGEAYQ